MIFKTLSGSSSIELLPAEEFLRLDATKIAREPGLYVNHANHQDEVRCGKVLEAFFKGTIRCFYPPNDDAPFDIAMVRVMDNVLVKTAEFKQRRYPSTKKF